MDPRPGLGIFLALSLLGIFSGFQESKGSPSPREAILRYYSQKTGEGRKKIYEKHIKPLAEKVVGPLQDSIEKLLSCYIKARKARRIKNRRKEEVKPVSKEKIRAGIEKILKEGKAPEDLLCEPGAIPGVKEALDILTNLRRNILRPRILKFIREQVGTGASFEGQYKPLKEKYGKAGIDVVLEIILDKQAMEEETVRIYAARAFMDFGEPDKRAKSALKLLVGDEYEPEELRREAAIILGRYGDTEALKPFFEKAKRQTEKPNPKARARGWQALAKLWHDIKEHAKSIECYTKQLDIMKKLVADKKWPEFFLSTPYYNRACSYAALGEIEKGIEDLKKAVQYKGIPKKLLLNDKEIDPLRKHPDFEKILEKAPERMR